MKISSFLLLSVFFFALHWHTVTAGKDIYFPSNSYHIYSEGIQDTIYPKDWRYNTDSNAVYCNYKYSYMDVETIYDEYYNLCIKHYVSARLRISFKEKPKCNFSKANNRFKSVRILRNSSSARRVCVFEHLYTDTCSPRGKVAIQFETSNGCKFTLNASNIYQTVTSRDSNDYECY